ncbi:hypothetical protein SNE40_004718 [Patella caerulea]|uniref:Copper transport protein n=1 Tax=Patella caerulea TaxID=87958 RepID=A0AAN8K9Y5_PATCE
MDHSAHHHHTDNLDHSGLHSSHSLDHEAHQSFFHTTYGNIILFKGWRLYDAKATFLTCLALAVLAVLFQLLKFIRHRFGRKCMNLNCRRYILNKNHIIQTVLYTIQFGSGYLVMLAVMTYNIWIGIAAIAGLGLGYFLFGWGEYEDGKRQEIMIVRPGRSTNCGEQLEQELLPLSKDASADTLITNVSGGLACTCDDEI